MRARRCAVCFAFALLVACVVALRSGAIFQDAAATFGPVPVRPVQGPAAAGPGPGAGDVIAGPEASADQLSSSGGVQQLYSVVYLVRLIWVDVAEGGAPFNGSAWDDITRVLGVVRNVASQLNPFRWTAWESIELAIRDLRAENITDLPVEVEFEWGSGGITRRHYATISAAISALEELERSGDIAMPFEFDPVVSKRLASMARASYCSCTEEEEAERPMGWMCGSYEVSGLRVKTDTVHRVDSNNERYFGVVARLLEPAPFVGACLVALRGTETLVNRVVNLNVMLMDLPEDWGCPGCAAHAGFLEAWLDLEENIVKALNRSGCESRPLFLTGHSLGGAMATLAAWSLKHKHGFKMGTIYTYECPRVGNVEFAAAWDASIAQTVPSFRITYWTDPVANWPCFLGKYVHVQYEVHYDGYGHFQALDHRVMPCEDLDLVMKLPTLPWDLPNHCDTDYVKDICCRAGWQ